MKGENDFFLFFFVWFEMLDYCKFVFFGFEFIEDELELKVKYGLDDE